MDMVSSQDNHPYSRAGFRYLYSGFKHAGMTVWRVRLLVPHAGQARCTPDFKFRDFKFFFDILLLKGV